MKRPFVYRHPTLTSVLIYGGLFAVLVAIAVFVAVLYYKSNENAKRVCREDGGRVIEIHNAGRANSWICDEPR